MPVKTISVRLTFVTSVRVNQEMASNDFILSSGSDTEVSEMEDYELEVEGSPNSSFAASDEEDTHQAYSDDPLADEEWLELYFFSSFAFAFRFHFYRKTVWDEAVSLSLCFEHCYNRKQHIGDLSREKGAYGFHSEP